MTAFWAALWAELLKARRSKVSVLTGAGFMILPLVGGLFMIILKNPERARELGLISMKAQLTGGVADWPTLFGFLTLGTAMGGSILFSFITAWVFGREYADHTAKELLAVPTRRTVIVAAKLVLLAVWFQALSLAVFLLGLGVGVAVNIPGWSAALQRSSFGAAMAISLLTFLLMPLVAYFASAGGGYLPPMGWAFLTLALGQIAIVLGWGDWFPWSVPGLLSSMAGSSSGTAGLHSYLMVLAAFLVGTVGTIAWWLKADLKR
jgi:ABC-2 type transport system permease protein